MVDSQDDNQQITTPQTFDKTTTNLQDLHISDSPHNPDSTGPSPSEGRTFVVDPNVMAQWGGGRESKPKNDIGAEEPQSADAATDENRDTNGNSNKKPSVDQDSLAPGDPTGVTVGSAKKKSKKRKSKSKRGLAAPTGFEEFYVDAPLTPAEFEEQKGLYDPDIAFSRRIEIAIQRYCARRNMDSTRKDVFDKFLSLGGISAGPKQFSGGLDAKDMSDMDAADIALMKAVHFVDLDKWGPEGAYEVDFESCVKSFFSSRVPEVYDLSGVDCAQQVKSKTNVIRNFLNYLLHHDVCPEYQSQIHAAKAVCDRTDRELPLAMRTQSYLPGDFQTACSEIFGGSLQGTSGQNIEWASDMEGFAGMNPDLAKQTFKIGMATHVSDEVTKSYMEQSTALNIMTTKSYKIGLEVTELIRASDEVKNFYERHSAAKGLKSLGRLIAKTWTPPYKLPKDLTEEERVAEATLEGVTEIHSFLVEDYILETCLVGLKLEVTVREMSFGLKFFDTIHGVFCSFYTLLPNELMIGWRTPEDEPLPYRAKNIAAVTLEDDIDGAEDDMEENADFQQVEENDAKDLSR